MDKTQINLERMRANDADWEEQKHPRAKNGQFTSGSGSAGGASKPSAEPAAGSPLKKAAAAGMRKVNPEYIRKLESQLESKKRIYEQENKSSNPDVKYIKNIQNQINEIDSELSEIKKNNGYAKEETPDPAPKKAAAPKKSNVLTGYKGKTYTQSITGAAANTPAGEVHNLIVGRIESANPTKAEIAEAAWYIADEDLNDNVHRCREMVQKFERDGNSYAARAWGDALKDAKKKVEICRNIAKSMSAKDSASPLQQAAAALQSK